MFVVPSTKRALLSLGQCLQVALLVPHSMLLHQQADLEAQRQRYDVIVFERVDPTRTRVNGSDSRGLLYQDEWHTGSASLRRLKMMFVQVKTLTTRSKKD